MRGNKLHKASAFTLIELAIVLVVIGILVGMGVGLVGMLTKRAKYNEAKEVVDAAVESVINFAAFNNRLPTSSGFPSVVRESKDPWGKELVYFPAPGLDSNSTNICGLRKTDLKVWQCQDASCSSYTTIDNVAFAVVSGGLNYNVQTSNASGIIKVYDYGTDNVDDYPDDGINRPEKYDDIVKWVTLYELQTKLQCQKGDKGRLTILNNELPYGFVGSNYEATVYADGGIPFDSGGKYKWCIEGSLPPGITANPNATSSNCLANPESFWGQADSFSLSGTPSQAGTYQIKVFVRDNADPTGENDNIATKSFVVTINPSQNATSAVSGPPGADVTFADLDNFVQTNPQGINTNPSQGTVFLGLNNYSTSSCLWIPTVYKFDGKTLRVYFEFKTLYVDTSSTSTDYADGFTFALIDANLGTSTCGGSGGGLGFLNIGSPSAAVEFDFYPNREYNDPGRWWNWWRIIKGYNHIDIDKDGSVTHSSPFNGYYNQNKPTWLEDGLWHKVRIEAWENGTQTCFKVWIDCTNCDDLGSLYSGTPTLYKCVNVTFSNGFYAGFTEATGGKTFNVELANFGLTVK